MFQRKTQRMAKVPPHLLTSPLVRLGSAAVKLSGLTAPNKPRAFTLVELLVVLGIITILIGILLPAMTRTRKSANTITCQSNLRQIQYGILLYVHNSHDYLPGGGLAAGSTLKGGDIWFRQIDPYLKNRSVHICPTASGPRFINLGSDLDYLANCHIIRVGKELKYSLLRTPIFYACLLEGDRSMSNFQWTAADFDAARQQWDSSPAYRGVFRRHADGMNVAFADGHVALVRGPAVVTNLTNFGGLGDARDHSGLWLPPWPTDVFLRKTGTNFGF
jgi:prepilin-type processing-associated H-X9-DG protein/prepilin-type N-terminal cleavage/methylation domain-containing protein